MSFDPKQASKRIDYSIDQHDQNYNLEHDLRRADADIFKQDQEIDNLWFILSDLKVQMEGKLCSAMQLTKEANELKAFILQTQTSIQRSTSIKDKLIIFKQKQLCNVTSNKPMEKWEKYPKIKEGNIEFKQQSIEANPCIDIKALKIKLGDPEFLSTIPERESAMRIIKRIPEHIKDPWKKYIELNKNPSTFAKSNMDLSNVQVQIIYLSEDKELLVRLQDGHVLYGDLRNICNLIIINDKCCMYSDVYAINFRLREIVNCSIIFDTVTNNWKAINIKKEGSKPVFMAWSECLQCQFAKMNPI